MLEDGGADAATEDERFEVWEENVRAVELFCVLGAQWRTLSGGMGPPQFLGLDYAAVEAVMRMRRVPAAERGALFEDLRVMEAAARKELNAKSNG